MVAKFHNATANDVASGENHRGLREKLHRGRLRYADVPAGSRDWSGLRQRVRRQDARTGKLIELSFELSGYVDSVAPGLVDDLLAVAACGKGQIRVWNARTGVEPRCYPGTRKVVGATGFEPATPCAQGRCATRLRYAPTEPSLSHPSARAEYWRSLRTGSH